MAMSWAALAMAIVRVCLRSRVRAPVARGQQHAPTRLKRAALRRLIQSALPEAWRYFRIDNYREIAALMPGSRAGTHPRARARAPGCVERLWWRGCRRRGRRVHDD
jgi:hypothetical protein